MAEKGGLLFLLLAVDNNSTVDYLSENWNFTVQDKRQPKRTAIRSLGMDPVSSTSFDGVPGKSASMAVFAFPGFTISDAKKFKIQVFEKNGDRNPGLEISGRELLKAEPILISNQK
ncbi:DUF4138 domain-containing protein [Algoriphagus sp. Y33]|uniref:DUF4138 domain-containing protein n=1 Tax=Algoriphagus sp. Y33 TaxID=2772483 RepID=UPI001780CA3F|nr:DUF4138 domain-containing protein [Algoriphagus sp. Y33]